MRIIRARLPAARRSEACRGGSLWPPLVLMCTFGRKRGGHREPPLQTSLLRISRLCPTIHFDHQDQPDSARQVSPGYIARPVRSEIYPRHAHQNYQQTEHRQCRVTEPARLEQYIREKQHETEELDEEDYVS